MKMLLMHTKWNKTRICWCTRSSLAHSCPGERKWIAISTQKTSVVLIPLRFYYIHTAYSEHFFFACISLCTNRCHVIIITNTENEWLPRCNANNNCKLINKKINPSYEWRAWERSECSTIHFYYCNWHRCAHVVIQYSVSTGPLENKGKNYHEKKKKYENIRCIMF